jgi:NADP-dependent 3-hydroxy acid dehydrogenase YdfG
MDLCLSGNCSDKRLVDTQIRVTEVQPGLVETGPCLTFPLSEDTYTLTEFSNVRYRGDASAAKKVYQGLEPCKYIFDSDLSPAEYSIT